MYCSSAFPMSLECYDNTLSLTEVRKALSLWQDKKYFIKLLACFRNFCDSSMEDQRPYFETFSKLRSYDV